MELSEHELEQMLARQADRVAKESDKRMKQYIGTLQEATDDKIQAIFEYVQDIPTIKERQDMMFNTMGEITEDLVIIKETVKNRHQNIRR